MKQKNLKQSDFGRKSGRNTMQMEVILPFKEVCKARNYADYTN